MARKVQEWKERKEAILRGEIVPSTATGEEKDIYEVQEEVTNNSFKAFSGCDGSNNSLLPSN